MCLCVCVLCVEVVRCARWWWYRLRTQIARIKAWNTTNYLTSMHAQMNGINKMRWQYMNPLVRCIHRNGKYLFKENKKIKKWKKMMIDFANDSVEIIITCLCVFVEYSWNVRYSTMESCQVQLYLCTIRWQRMDNYVCNRHQKEMFRTLCIHRIR